MLREEFMKPLRISIDGLAVELQVPVTHLTELVNEQCRITADMAFRLARRFGTSADFWMNLEQRRMRWGSLRASPKHECVLAHRTAPFDAEVYGFSRSKVWQGKCSLRRYTWVIKERA